MFPIYFFLNIGKLLLEILKQCNTSKKAYITMTKAGIKIDWTETKLQSRQTIKYSWKKKNLSVINIQIYTAVYSKNRKKSNFIFLYIDMMNKSLWISKKSKY